MDEIKGLTRTINGLTVDDRPAEARGSNHTNREQLKDRVLYSCLSLYVGMIVETKLKAEGGIETRNFVWNCEKMFCPSEISKSLIRTTFQESI